MDVDIMEKESHLRKKDGIIIFHDLSRNKKKRNFK